MICNKCKKEIIGKYYHSFGNIICEECKNNRPKKGTGNSGLRDNPQNTLFHESGLHLELVPKSNGIFGHLFFSHYPKSKGIPGRSLCYNIYDYNDIIGIIGVNSPPANYKIFREFFKTQNDNCFMNNNVFRLIKNEKNLGTKILKLFRNRVRSDYKNKYNEDIKGIITFVELPRTGALYKADNWDYLGQTQGKRMRRDPQTWEKIFIDGEIKHIFGYKYR